MLLRPARAPSAPGSVDAFPSYGLRGGAYARCGSRAIRGAPSLGWAWGLVSMFTISGYSCTTYRAAFSSYTYLTERIEYKSLIPVTNPLANRFTTRRQIVRFSPLPGARGGAGRMVVERINKTDCEPRCAANSRARNAAERMPRVSEVGSDDVTNKAVRCSKLQRASSHKPLRALPPCARAQPCVTRHQDQP